jgi:hypothetical protein
LAAGANEPREYSHACGIFWTFESRHHHREDIHAGVSFSVAVWQPIDDSRELLFACLVFLVLLIITIEEF